MVAVVRPMTNSPGPMGAEEWYRKTCSEFGAALERLARGYEADTEKRRDLLQEIHVALWRSFDRFDGRCSLRTWVYRVAHHTATSKALRTRRRRHVLISLDEMPLEPSLAPTQESDFDERRALERLLLLIRQLKPLDRQVMLLYLEGEDAASTGEVTGLSPGAVATKVHRVKQLLRRQFYLGVSDAR
jgi:RNA polymerase sigma-70 factor, ECF subfamily